MLWHPGSGDLGVVFNDCLGVMVGGDHGVMCLRFGRLLFYFFGGHFGCSLRGGHNLRLHFPLKCLCLLCVFNPSALAYCLIHVY